MTRSVWALVLAAGLLAGQATAADVCSGLPEVGKENRQFAETFINKCKEGDIIVVTFDSNSYGAAADVASRLCSFEHQIVISDSRQSDVVRGFDKTISCVFTGEIR